MNLIDLKRYFKDIPFHKDIHFNKNELPVLPSCFKLTNFGELRPGMLGQYRCELLHAYEFREYWLIHRDRRNPETHPWEHLVEDAPHWLVVGGLIGAAAVGSIIDYFSADKNDDYQ